jgi:hypothetical protein
MKTFLTLILSLPLFAFGGGHKEHAGSPAEHAGAPAEQAAAPSEHVNTPHEDGSDKGEAHEAPTMEETKEPETE